jgi:hypothetical protein
MIIYQFLHGLALISSYTDQREAISEMSFQAPDSTFYSQKTQQSNLSWLHKAFSSLPTLKETLSKDRSSLTSESELESEVFLEDLPMRQRSVKSPYLRLTFSSSSELDESLLKKSKSLKAAHARDMIF